MIKIENTDVYGWKAAVRGMRNPMNSWSNSDSFVPCYLKMKCHECEANQKCAYYFEDGNGLPYKKDEFIGARDLDLMNRLCNAGTDHGKFMRMITITCDITAPLYWWKEADQYKVGTVTNSCSTMHKIHAKEFTINDFSYEHLMNAAIVTLSHTINDLNQSREVYLYGGELCDKHGNWTHFEPKDKEVWWQMIQLLPSSYNQRRTILLNYAVLRNMYHARKNHRLDEWHTFCKWIETLPYSELITGKED